MDRSVALSEHLAIHDIEWIPFRGINAAKWGLTTLNPYDESGKIVEQKHVGLHLSHYILWQMFHKSEEHYQHGDNCEWTVIEDDCRFTDDWAENYDLARNHLPEDWDMLMLGSCCTEGRPTVHIGGNVYEVKYPLCTHAYVVRGKALSTLITTQEKAWTNIDISLFTLTYPELNVYTILPRIAYQDGMELPV